MKARQAKEALYAECVRLDYELCDRNFINFFQSSWEILEPKVPLLFNWHHELIAEYLTACYLRQIKRLIINIPPRYSKSNLVTVTFPAWVWAKTPQERFIVTSYSNSLSTKHSVDRRTVIESAWYQNRWGCHCNKWPHDPKCHGFKMASDQNVKTEFSNDKRGHMIATSMGGSATGKGGNILIVDDPHDTTRAHSDTMRESDIQEFDQKFTTRLDDKTNGVIIIVMQRLHEDDLTGHCLEQGIYTHLCLPATEHTPRTLVFPMSKKTIVREEGDILHPRREDAKALDAQRKALGSYGYESQYQQAPSPREGGIFKKSYWKYYSRLPVQFSYIFDAWDMSFKDLQTSDFVAGTVWGVLGADRYLLNVTCQRMGFIDSIRAIRQHRSVYPEISRTVIEDKANGSAIIEVMQREVMGIIAFDPGSKSKEERAAAVEPQFEAGNILLPAPGLATFDVESFINTFAKFPAVKHDDIIDSTTMALLYARDTYQAGSVRQAAKDIASAQNTRSSQYDGSIFDEGDSGYGPRIS